MTGVSIGTVIHPRFRSEAEDCPYTMCTERVRQSQRESERVREGQRERESEREREKERVSERGCTWSCRVPRPPPSRFTVYWATPVPSWAERDRDRERQRERERERETCAELGCGEVDVRAAGPLECGAADPIRCGAGAASSTAPRCGARAASRKRRSARRLFGQLGRGRGHLCDDALRVAL